jgi:hypothetical protein
MYKLSQALVEKPTTRELRIYKTLGDIRNHNGCAEKDCKGDVNKTKTNRTTVKPTYEIPKDLPKEQ